MLKAVIMAGGEGTRLRPITCSTPKSLVPVCGKPVIDYLLELLKKHQCRQVTMALFYLGHQIEAHYPEREYQGLPLEFCYEETPLGTAGSVRNAVGETTEPLLVISGDQICDFDLTAAIRYHQEVRAAATLIAKRVDDLREYGLLQQDSTGRVIGFLEKPPLSRCTTDLANTGIYILSPEAIKLIPLGEKRDFAADLFPAMLERGMPIFAYEETGYWCDIGDLHSYQKCQRDLLDGKSVYALPKTKQEGVYSNTDLSSLHCKIEPPVYIGQGVTIGENSFLGSGTVIGDHVTIGENVKIRSGILHDCSCISDHATCNRAVLCKNARMLCGSAAYEGAILGEGATLGIGSTLASGARVWNQKEIAENILVTGDVKYGAARSIIIDDDGISGETNRTITPELMTKLGAAAGSLKPSCTIGIASNRTKSGRAFRQALSAGITAAGANVLDFGETIGSEYDFCLSKSDADFGIYVDSNILTNILLTEKRGIPMMRHLERNLEHAMNRGEYKQAGWNSFGLALDMSDLRQLYQNSLLQEAGADLRGVSVQVKSADPRVSELLRDTLKKLGCNTRSTRLSLMISPDGRSLSVYTPESGYLFPEKVLCMVCLAEFLDGKDVAVPFDAPLVLEEFGKQYGRRVLRYDPSPCDQTDMETRQMLARRMTLRDGMVLAIRLLSFLKNRGMTVSEASRLLPEFQTASRLVGVQTSPGAVLRQLDVEHSDRKDGTAIVEERGRVLLRPMKSGRGILLLAESNKSETAAELCDFYEQKIRQTDCPPS